MVMAKTQDSPVIVDKTQEQMEVKAESAKRERVIMVGGGDLATLNKAARKAPLSKTSPFGMNPGAIIPAATIPLSR
jgi:hypothetical protein